MRGKVKVVLSRNETLFFDKRDPYHLSKIAKHYIAGVLRHAREMSIVTNQWVNSYKRLITGYEAPINVLWAQNNRSALVRIPVHKSGKEESVRVEFRSPDPACNPYLAYSVMLAAGLKGIQEQYKLPLPQEEDLTHLSRQERSVRGVEQLPSNLGEAIQIAEGSDFLKEALGKEIFNMLIQNKKIEWDNYRRHVSQYEINKSLPIL